MQGSARRNDRSRANLRANPAVDRAKRLSGDRVQGVRQSRSSATGEGEGGALPRGCYRRLFFLAFAFFFARGFGLAFAFFVVRAGFFFATRGRAGFPGGGGAGSAA